MTIDITARRFPLTTALREYAERRLEALERLHLQVQGARVVLDHDDQHSAEQYLVKAHVRCSGHTLDAEAHGRNLYDGIDLAVEKLRAQGRRLHEVTACRYRGDGSAE